MAKEGSLVRVGPSTIAGAGNGLFATEDIPRNRNLTWYDGSIMPREQADFLAQTSPDAGAHFKRLDANWVIDGKKLVDAYVRGNRSAAGAGLAAFANTTSDPTKINVTFQKDSPAGGVAVPYWEPYPGAAHNERWLLRTTKAVKAGDELLVRYGRVDSTQPGTFNPHKHLEEGEGGTSHKGKVGPESEIGGARLKYATKFFEELGNRQPTGKYSFVEKIGSGSYGKTYKFWSDHYGRYVAIKSVLYGEISLRAASGEKSYSREPEVTQELKIMELFAELPPTESAGVMSLLDSYLSSNEKPLVDRAGARIGAKRMVFLNFVMPHFQCSLNSLLYENHWQQDFTIEDLEAIFLQVCVGVRSLRRKRVVHGDLNPRNVVVNFEYDDNNPNKLKSDVRIIDFGASSFARPYAEERVRRCTLDYRSPEELLGNVRYRQTCDSDLWSLGAMGAKMFFVVDDPKDELIPFLRESALHADMDADMEAVPQLTSILYVLGSPSAEELAILNPELPDAYKRLLLDVRRFESRLDVLIDAQTQRKERDLLNKWVKPLLVWIPANRAKGFNNFDIFKTSATEPEEFPKDPDDEDLHFSEDTDYPAESGLFFGAGSQRETEWTEQPDLDWTNTWL